MAEGGRWPFGVPTRSADREHEEADRQIEERVMPAHGLKRATCGSAGAEVKCQRTG